MIYGRHREHKSSCLIYINKLMKDILIEIPGIKEIDPKFKELDVEIDRQIEMWTEIGYKGIYFKISKK